MGIHLELIDFDEVFTTQLHKTPIVLDYDELQDHQLFQKRVSRPRTTTLNQAMRERVVINNLSDTSAEEKDYINRSIYTQYSTDNVIDVVPTCECGKSQGRYRIGTTCQVCGTVVENRYEDDIQSVIWIKAPRGLPALINPIAWTILSKRFMAERRFDTLRWICDTSYVGPSGKPATIVQLEERKIKRGLRNFYNHFDEIMEVLFDLRNLPAIRNVRKDEVREFVKKYRHAIFCQYLPLPNKLLMVVEKTNFGTYIDPGITGALDALWLMAGIDNELSSLKPWQKENRTIKAVCLLADYHSDLLRKVYMKKEGLFRADVYATRATFSFRCVISSITEAHQLEEIHIPWGVGVTVLRHHLINKLNKRGWVPKDIIRLLDEYVLKYHPLLDQLMQEIINDHRASGKYIGIPTIAVRNPSLKRGSMQRLMITKVKPDVKDVTVSLSINIVRPFNADFDGVAYIAVVKAS